MVIARLPPIAADAKGPATVNFDTVLEPGKEFLASVVWSAPAGLTLGSGQYAPTLSADLRKSTLWLIPPSTPGTYIITGVYTTTNAPPRIDAIEFELTIA